MSFQGDVKLFERDSEFVIEFINGVATLTVGFDTAVNLSLFGGNYDDDGRVGNPRTYWANRLEIDEAAKYVSRTQHILRGLPATSGNVPKVEAAMLADTKWLLDLGVANLIEAEVTIPGLNRVDLKLTITAQGERSTFTFTANWVEWIPTGPIEVPVVLTNPGPPTSPTGGLPLTPFVTSGKSMRFNGTDERLQGPLLTIVDSENEGYSWATWIRYRHSAGTHIPFTLRRSDSPGGSKRNATMLHLNDNGDLLWHAYGTSGSFIKNMQWNGVIPDGVMAHIAIRFVAGTDVASLFINGADQGVADVVTTDLPGEVGGANFRAFYFGGDFNDALFCDCDIFSYSLYDVEMADAEFSALYNGGDFANLDPQVNSGDYVSAAGLAYYYDFCLTSKPAAQTGGTASPYLDLTTLIGVGVQNCIDDPSGG